MSQSRPNLCLTAGAGAGKTTRLVETYAALLAGRDGPSPLEPSQIVAITFTDKAAAEMRSRIVQKLGGRSGQAATLAWAPISTIHSFCAQLLREHGVALCLDPDFTVLDQDRYHDLLREAIQDLLRAGLKSQDPRLARVLGHYYLSGRGGLEELLAWLQRGLATMGLAPQEAREATARAHAEALKEGGERLAAMGRLLADLALLVKSGAVNLQAGYGRTISELLSRWPALRADLGRQPAPSETLAELDRLTKGNWYAANKMRQLLRPLAEEMIAAAAVPAAAQLADDLLSLAEDLAASLEQERVRRAALDFDSLLIKARDLLRDHPEVQAQLRQRWRALLVDEYQDVNPVQGELVDLLAGLGAEPQAADRPWLMVVGDRKQSIYAFRGAAVAVFNETMLRFEAGAGAVEALPHNYRSQPALVHFFNRLFAQVFSASQLREQAPESWVEFCTHDSQSPAAELTGAPGERPVQVLDCRHLAAVEMPVAAWRLLEARSLAAWLRQALDGGRYRPGQVAMLFRRLTSVAIYEEALREAGVDFYTVRGRGFYACPEIGDLAAALQALLDPGQELALAAWLRSPLVGLSDESLLALTHPHPPEALRLSMALTGAEPLPDWCGPDQQRRLAEARRMLRDLGGLARRLRPAELITWLLEESDLIPLLLGTSAGSQKTANLRKLIEVARQPGGGLAGGVEAFAAGLARLAAEPPQDPQASLLGEESQVVRLMTVHQAKGLEFPLVVLADLAGGEPGGGGLPPDLGPNGLLAPAPLEPASGLRLQSPLYQRLRQREQAVAEAEAARLFYVACTRAERELLICLNGAKSQGRWSKWVQEMALADEAVRVVDAAGLLAQAAPEPRSAAQAWPERLPPAPGPAQDEARQVLAQCLHRPPVALGRVRESVSGLENFLACPRLYVLTQRLGLDTAALPGLGSSGLARAVELGSLVHGLLETCDLAAGPDGLAPALARLEPQPELAQPALALARGLWNTELPALLASVPAEHLHRELPFRLLLAGEDGGPEFELVGELDLAARLPKGQWLIADYKVTARPDPEAYRQQLGLYALALHQGQEGGSGPLPRVALCFLGSQGGSLAWLEFSAADLAGLEARVRRAADEIAALGGLSDPFVLPAGPDCSAGHCALRWLCSGKEAA
ncbi:MAG: hypothetical protein C4525_17130 [Desulfarculus sp.]|nr:MAG: hypothetical protein C4525_17130 [Desulfarculus sp.]